MKARRKMREKSFFLFVSVWVNSIVLGRLHEYFLAHTQTEKEQLRAAQSKHEMMIVVIIARCPRTNAREILKKAHHKRAMIRFPESNWRLPSLSKMDESTRAQVIGC